MIPLIIFVLLGLIILCIFEYNARCRIGKKADTQVLVNKECCGQHLVCERDLQQELGTEIIYFDDEELDEMRGLPPDKFSEQQIEDITHVFNTLNDNDIRPWLHSLQLRNIELPPSLREKVLLVLQDNHI